ncbi:MAG: hypothetical protein R3279_13545 [Putridiphycobacter sp.]|nr:hypothetical protein [Putridiphycobacter sp.]
MKKGLIFLISIIVLLPVSTNAQKRYYPSLTQLFDSDSDRKISSEFNYFSNWLAKIVKNCFYKDLQFSISPNEDAGFYSLGLIVKKSNSYTIANSGFEVKFNEGEEKFSTPIRLRYEYQYKILAYLRGYDIDYYKPDDYEEKFNIALRVLNMNQSQAMSQFINVFVEYPKDKSKTSVDVMLATINAQTEKPILIENPNDKRLTEICKEIYKTTGDIPSTLLYKCYIYHKDKEIELANFVKYFRSLIPNQMSYYIDDMVAYQSTLSIPNREISIAIPKKMFIPINDSVGETVVSLAPHSIDFSVVNTIAGKCITLDLKMNAHAKNVRFYLSKKLQSKEHEKNKVFESKVIKSAFLKIYEKKIEFGLNLDNGHTFYNHVIYQKKIKFKK